MRVRTSTCSFLVLGYEGLGVVGSSGELSEIFWRILLPAPQPVAGGDRGSAHPADRAFDAMLFGEQSHLVAVSACGL